MEGNLQMFKDRHPKYEKYRSMRGGVYTLEGGVAGGKSTAGRSMANKLNEMGISAQFFPEYVNRRLLRQFIRDMNRYAYSFQMLMLFKRIEIYNEAERFANTGGIAIIDRSIMGDMTFARMQMENGNITNDEWNTYLEVVRDEIRLVPSASLFLKCSVETSMERIRVRGNEEEIRGYSVDYIKQLLASYDKSIAVCTNVRHVIIDWDQSTPIINGHLSDNMVYYLLDQLV
jgi:deoxyadenosine/deoxycytidine kinase